MITENSKHLADEYDVAIVGGGSAGLAAALSAKENGAERVLVVDREKEAGGILLQCIHHGFSPRRSGVEYKRLSFPAQTVPPETMPGR